MSKNTTPSSAVPSDQKKTQTIKGTSRTEEEELQKLKQELEQMTELAKRTMADLQNYKRRQEEERRLIINMATANLILSLLPVLDNLERAKKHSSDLSNLSGQVKEWFSGIEISINQFQKVLEETGLKKIESLDQKFNPELHEALVHSPGEKDIIIEELEKGYILGDRVIRHAKVKVGNGSPGLGEADLEDHA